MQITPFIWTLFWNIFVALWIIIVVIFARFITKKLQNYLDFITAITVWLLLWIIFLWFFPELIEEWIDVHFLWIFVLVWIFLFYILELFLHWHHCKDLNPWDLNKHKHEHESWKLIFAWTVLHNTFHWVEIFAAFSINTSFWIIVSIAILLHSIPQNVVNYVMNHNNLKIVLIWAFSWVFGAVLTYPFWEFLIDNKLYVLAIIAGWLLYTALADIFPSFKSKWNFKNKINYLVFVILGIFLFLWFNEISWHEHKHNEKYHSDKNLKDKD